MGTPRRLRIGTRGSELARVQTAWVTDRLAELGQGPVETVVITTSGDQSPSVPLGTGVFVREIQRGLLEERIDLAVHSLKDLPTDPTPGLVLGAIPGRADPRDALVGARLDQLAAGDRVGTGSPRRAAQLRRLRPDLEVVAIRGNIGTRIARIGAGQVAAVLLAAAGLERLGIAPDQVLSEDDMLPAPGQGALAVEIRAEDHALAEVVRPLDHPPTRAGVVAERAVLRRLGGGCLLPVATYGRVVGGRLRLDASVTAADGSAQARASAEGDADQPEQLGTQVGEDLLAQGAAALLEALH